MEIAKLTSKGQITIPKAVRDDLELETGSKVIFIREGSQWSLLATPTISGSKTSEAASIQSESGRILQELAAKYDVEWEQKPSPKSDAEKRSSFDELWNSIADGFDGVAESSGWESEQDIVDYIKKLRRGDDQ